MKKEEGKEKDIKRKVKIKRKKEERKIKNKIKNGKDFQFREQRKILSICNMKSEKK